MKIIAKNSTWVVYLERERARRSKCKGVLCAGARSPDQRLYKGHVPPKSEDDSSSEVNRPEFTPSQSYTFIRQKSEIFHGIVPHYGGELQHLKKIYAIPAIPRWNFKPCIQWSFITAPKLDKMLAFKSQEKLESQSSQISSKSSLPAVIPAVSQCK